MRFVLPFVAATAFCQTFTPVMPPGVPEVQGDITESATLRFVDVAKGTGAIAGPGHQYTVHYTGWLRDGTKFDSSRDRDEPIRFVQGRRQVIAGWEAGFEGMRAGGKRRLFIPYQMAYGEKGSGPIPPKAELIFDVELIAVKDVPDLAPSADIVLPLKDLESKVVDLAKAIPEAKMSWRPAPGVRSFAEVFLHIAYGNHLLLGIGTKPPSSSELKQQIQANARGEKEPVSKDAIVQRLLDSFAAVRKVLEPARAGTLARDMDFFGRPTTMRGIFVSLDTHVAEHLGQAIAYARMNGIAPPWSSGPTE